MPGGARRLLARARPMASSAQLAEGAFYGRAARDPPSRLDGLKRQQAAAVHGLGLRPRHSREAKNYRAAVLSFGVLASKAALLCAAAHSEYAA